MDVHTQSKKRGNLMEMDLPYLEIFMTYVEREREGHCYSIINIFF